MAGSASGPRAKGERANKHIAELEGIVQRFRDSDPYEVVPEQKPETEDLIGRVRETAPLPDTCVSLVAGDIIHNLRSALDILFYGLVAANKVKPKRSDSFPISKDRQVFEADVLPQIKGRVRPEVIEALKELKPYRGGNDSFWHLHKLDIIDKHRLLIAVGGDLQEVIQSLPIPEGGVDVGGIWLGGLQMHIETPTFRPLKDGEVVADPLEPDHELKFRIEVALHEPPVVERQPVVPFVRQLAGLVTETIDLLNPPP